MREFIFFLLLVLDLIGFHETAFDVDGYRKEIDEEEAKDSSIKLYDLSQADSQ